MQRQAMHRQWRNSIDTRSMSLLMPSKEAAPITEVRIEEFYWSGIKSAAPQRPLGFRCPAGDPKDLHASLPNVRITASRIEGDDVWAIA